MVMKVKVCMGTHCTMMGNLHLYEDLLELARKYPDKIDLDTVKCLNSCSEGRAPVVLINDTVRLMAKSQEIIAEILEDIV